MLQPPNPSSRCSFNIMYIDAVKREAEYGYGREPRQAMDEAGADWNSIQSTKSERSNLYLPCDISPAHAKIPAL